MGAILSGSRTEGEFVTFAREGLIENRTELEPIFEAHWEDVVPDFGNVALRFDWDSYGAMEKAGQVHFMVARAGECIAGYHLCLANRHLHSMGTQVAMTAFYYMLPAFRNGFTVMRLFRESEKALKSLGIQSIYLPVKTWRKTGRNVERDLAPLLMRLGYYDVERTFAKELA